MKQAYYCKKRLYLFLGVITLLTLFSVPNGAGAKPSGFKEGELPKSTGKKTITGLRDCVVWLRGEANVNAIVAWQSYYANDSTVNYLYFQAPDGKLLNRIKINKRDSGGSQALLFSEGSGDYRLEIPGYFYRKASVELPELVQMVLEPAKFHFSLHAQQTSLYFDVPEDTQSFTLCGRYHEGPEKIHLYDPSGQEHDVLALADSSEVLYFDRLKVDTPLPGAWCIELEGSGKVSFWVDGVNNYFALNPDDLFIPEKNPGLAVFSGNGRTGIMGKIGGQLVGTSKDQKIFDGMQYMGLHSFNYYIDHQWREPENSLYPSGGDNDDPETIDWSGFKWENSRIDYYRNTLGAEISCLFNSKDSWLGTPLTLEKQKEFAEFTLAYITHFNDHKSSDVRWFSPWDEPNLSAFTYDEYASLVYEVGTRLKAAGNPLPVRETKLLALSSSGFDGINTGAGRSGDLWAARLYAEYDELVDGIAFDYWNVKDLVETWRFRNAVSIAAQIISGKDSDGMKTEQIVINQTSMTPGKSSSPYDVNTQFGALWLTGAICNAFGTGQLNAFHYYTTVDDTKHMKGLMYSDELPLSMPYSPEVQSFEIKPIGQAMAMMNETLLDDVVILNSDSIEVDALLTISADRTAAGLVVANKSQRPMSFQSATILPGSMLNRQWTVTGLKLATAQEPVAISENKQFATTGQFRFDYELAPETVYVFSFRLIND